MGAVSSQDKGTIRVQVPGLRAHSVSDCEKQTFGEKTHSL